jgi:hypothetical protein
MNVGDSVRIITKEYDVPSNDYKPHFGCTGAIKEISRKDGRDTLYLIERDIGTSIWYVEGDMELIGKPVMSSDFSLDEIAQGEEIIAQMD